MNIKIYNMILSYIIYHNVQYVMSYNNITSYIINVFLSPPPEGLFSQSTREYLVPITFITL